MIVNTRNSAACGIGRRQALAAGVLGAASLVLPAAMANAAGASLTARKALGFEDLLTGDIEAMKRRTRNYARRQLTWMRKLADVRVIDTTGRTADDVAAEILSLWTDT